MRRITNSSLAACIVLACSLADANAQEATTAGSALTVELVKPVVRQWPETIAAAGWLQPWQEAVISSEASGLKTASVLVDVGSKVKRGDLLAELDSASILADISKQQAAVGTAVANLDEANANVDRAHTLGNSGALSGQTITQYLITQRTAQASVESEKAGLESEQIKLQQTRIVAPDDGTISSRSATLGAVVSTGTEMFRLIRQDRVEWQAEVPAQYLNSVKQGQTAYLTLSDGTQVIGTVRLVSPTIVKETGRSVVFVSLPTDAAHSGQFATGTIRVAVRPSLNVPQTAVVQRDGLSYVFVLADESHVERKLVQLGRRRGDRVEITEGIDVSANVVKAGGSFLSDGASV
ncbi:MAG: efflux RND transporter periplasmic adaptor subunit, partial [Rhizobiaceae bacterium]|nr:efflux RND transporter periplasmic adaptor subunit [Rhizobiaceae bacterium]